MKPASHPSASLPIEIISASAGSGKTHRLAGVLEDAVKNKSVRPHAVIATTFTIKAAAELRERVRRRLLEAGLSAEAQQLNAAIMGTINSVCGRLVSDFAFDLGVSPELRVLDEDMAARALRRALSGVVDKESDRAIGHLQQTFSEWKPDVLILDVVNRARANGLDSKGLDRSRDRCLAEVDEILGPPLDAPQAESLERELQDAIGAFRTHVERGEDSTKTTAGALDTASKFITSLASGKILPWQAWNKIATLGTAKKSANAAAPVQSLASRHIAHPRFRDDLASAVSTVFGLAARALRAYEEYKSERGFIDFTDQECLALRLLSDQAVRARLEGGIDLVLVDEFQDTSPIQLAIFLALARIARRSVWVGDQKQSIFAFRGSDPELMNAAIDAILAGREPETLPKSWRSRPALVALTSDKEPKGLGPILEHWALKPAGRSNAAAAAALASAIKSCLDDPKARVRDKAPGGAPRCLEPRDVAVLCRKHATCELLARSLAEVGVKSALSRGGLMKTLEARLMLSALRLWSDPRDALSAAEIARLLEHPADPDSWLAALLARPGADAFASVPAVAAIKDAAASDRSRLGVVAAFDRIAEILSIRDLCRRWGDASDRLANLNVLRSFAVRYAAQASDEGAGMTPAGLSAFLAGLDDGQTDTQAFSPAADAVVISTWHGAKGLEWPVVVLYELDFSFRSPAPEMRIASDRPRIALDDPLADRWIRYWPNPYHRQTKARYHELLREHRAAKEAEESERRESLRLLYVGWTRARDRVVLACRAGKLKEGMLEGLGADIDEILKAPGASSREAAAREPAPIEPRPESIYVTDGPKEHPPAKGSPDMTGRAWEAGEPEILGDPIALRAPTNMMNLGSAVHGFLAADQPEYSRDERLEMAEGLLKRWNVGAALNPADLLEMRDRLRKWIDGKWPNAKWHREWPMFMRLDSGSIVHGVADLILETPDGFVVIDHKAYLASPADARKLALEFAEQIQSYSCGIFRSQSIYAALSYIHLVLIGEAVKIK